MSTYIVPPDMKEKEKIVGGVLTFPQFGWLMGGLVLAGVIFIVLFPLMNIFGLVLALPVGLVFGLPFAFYKKEDLTFFRYLVLKRKFKGKNLRLPCRRG